MPIAHPFTERDLKQLRDHGIPTERAAGYLATFAKGLPYVVLDRPCATGDGVTVLDESGLERLCRRGDEAAGAGRFSKFVPASGAATRMFQPLLSAGSRAADEGATVEDLRDLPEYPALREFMARLERFAFYPELKAILDRQGRRLQPLRDTGRFRAVLDCLLDPGGLGYAGLPKALIPFHRYPDDCRTPVAEHLVNARAYVRDRDGTARVHFTVFPRASSSGGRARRGLAAALRGLRHAVRRDPVGTAADTDTLAATPDNRPFREPDGGLSFRPGGHGALLANLNDLGGDVVFIQNIDNVAMDSGTAIRCRKALAGYLVELQSRVFNYLDGLHRDAAPTFLDEVLRFARAALSVAPPEGLGRAPAAERVRFLREILDRPLRVCGMVPSGGEPGGGPFWVRGADGTCSLQIVESSQVNMEEPGQKDVFAASTHFNPWIWYAASVTDPANAST